VIVAFWVLLAVVAIVLLQVRLISRLPNELFRTALQAVGVLFGTYASKGLHSRSKKQKEDDLGLSSQHGQKIVDYIAANGAIDNEACQKVTGLGQYQVYRLLKRLQDDGVLKSEGANKGRKYIRTACCSGSLLQFTIECLNLGQR
jgi:hypothetical protein